MATNISTFSQVLMIDSRTRGGTTFFPSSFTIPGRSLIFKDQFGAFSTNTMTLTTNNANQTIDSLITSTINGTRLGWQNFIAGNNNRWYTVGGTLINTINTSTLTALTASTIQISSGNILTSTLAIRDQTFSSTNTLVSQSTFLIYAAAGQSTIISGTRQSFGGLLMRAPLSFQPDQISNLILWMDAADTNTVSISSDRVTAWRDKSSNRYVFTGSAGTLPTYTSRLNGLPVISSATGQKLTLTNWNQNFTVATMFFLIRPTQNIVVDFQGYPIFRRVTGTGTLQLDISFFNQSPYFYYLQIWTNNSFMLQASLNISGTFNPTNLPLLMTGVANGIANGNIGRYNGATLATTPLNNATTFVNLTGVTIDLIGANDARNFDTAEILLYGRVLTASEYEQVEGYLAWKWGLVGNLPITHPFRFIPPIFSLPVPPTPISSFDFNNYTASSSTLANSIAGGGAMTVYLPANNTFVTSSPGNFHLTIFAPNNFPSSTGGLSVATVTNARTIEMWVRYDGVAGNLGYGQYFLDARNGLTNGYWITSANSTADNIGGGNADFNNGIFYNNGTPTTINAVAGTPLVGPVLINTGWRQIVIVLPNSFTDDIAFFIRFSLDIQGMPISVAQISIYNEALSQAQVRSLFNSKRTRYGLSPI